MKKQKKNKNYLMFIGLALGLLGGILLGMVIQQMIFIAGAIEVGESLEGTTFNIEVDINETKLVEETKRAFMPILNETRDLMLEEQKKGKEELILWDPKENLYTNNEIYNISLEKSFDYYGECYINNGDKVPVNLVVVNENKILMFECEK